MTTLRNTVTEPDGTALDGWFDIALVGSPFRAGTQSEVLGPIKDRPFTGGAWSVDLVPGLYLVTQRRRTGAFHSQWTAQVPDAASVWLADCLVTVPGTPASTALLGIAAADVDAGGHLLLTYTDGTAVDAGLVVGPQGPPWTGSATEFGQAVADEIDDETSPANASLRAASVAAVEDAAAVAPAGAWDFVQAPTVAGAPLGGTPAFATSLAGSTFTVLKDPTTGFWPTSYSADGTPSYTGGATNAGVRPTARGDVFFQWKGPDPSPGIVSSGTGGMRSGLDTRFVTP